MIDINTIKNEPEKYIKWMCFNIFISIDNQVFNLSFKLMKEQLIVQRLYVLLILHFVIAS